MCAIMTQRAHTDAQASVAGATTLTHRTCRQMSIEVPVFSSARTTEASTHVYINTQARQRLHTPSAPRKQSVVWHMFVLLLLRAPTVWEL